MMLVATKDLFQVKEPIFSLFRPKKLKVHFIAKIDNFNAFFVNQLFSVDAKVFFTIRCTNRQITAFIYFCHFKNITKIARKWNLKFASKRKNSLILKVKM